MKIDPPYNTGNDFVYNDNFTMSVEESEIAEGNRDELGELYQVNSKSQNRYHANWLNMMYPRLKVAKDLLTEDGVIFISIDDNEVENLRKLCDEIFGKINSTVPLLWTLPRGINAGLVARAHEYVLCYTKNYEKIKNFNSITSEIEYSVERCNKKIDARHPMSEIHFPAGIEYEGIDKVITGCIEGSERIEIIGELVFKDGKLANPVTLKAGWTMKNMILSWLAGEQVFDTKGQKIIKFFFKENGKLYSVKEINTLSIKSVLKDIPDTQLARQEMDVLFDSQDIFPYPKTKELVKLLCKLSTKNDDVIFDFFSGSATTAQAVIELNAINEGESKRRFIMTQLPELTPMTSEANQAGYKNICEIGKERIRRAGDKIITDKPELANQLDIGFKVFKVADTNIKWNHQTEIGEQFTVDTSVYTPDLMDFMPGAKDEDIVYEVMLRQNDVPLSTTLETLTDIGQRTYLYASSYLVCLETEITVALVDKLAALNPLPFKFIFRDSAFQDDIALKDETFRRLKALIEKNAGTSKKTYTVEFI